MKHSVHQEEALVLWASKRTGRPVKWISTRSKDTLRTTKVEIRSSLPNLGYQKTENLQGYVGEVFTMPAPTWLIQKYSDCSFTEISINRL